MARYKKADNCGPVGYPDQSGRYLGEGEVVEDDENNNWAPLVALGFIVETGDGATPDKEESPSEMVAPVEVAPEPEPAPVEVAPEPEPAPVEVAPRVEEKPKKRRSKRKKKEGVSDGLRSANDGAGTEEMDSSASGESDS